MSIPEIKVLDHGFVRYVDHMGTDARIVEAARVSYHAPSKGPEQDEKLLRYLLKNQHTSPFEQCQITFNIKMPIFVMRQFVRHRMQSLNEVSARYTELPGEFYVPEKFRMQDNVNKQGSVPLQEGVSHIFFQELTFRAYQQAYAAYQQLLSMGVARELARLVLPVGIYTEIYTTWDMNNLLKFFRLRDDPHAQWEHQQFAFAMKEIAKILFPWTMQAYEDSRIGKL